MTIKLNDKFRVTLSQDERVKAGDTLIVTRVSKTQKGTTVTLCSSKGNIRAKQVKNNKFVTHKGEITVNETR